MQPDLAIVMKLNGIRRSLDLLDIEGVLALSDRGNVVFDPFSVLISKHARIGTENVFYSCVSILSSSPGGVSIGDRNIFHTGTWVAAEMGPVIIGSGNQFGEGGFTAKANRPGARIIVGDGGRYLGGASVYGETELGSGSQLLGAINVDSCFLAGGASFRDSEPDRRGALLKGQGTARNLRLDTGQVISANGIFRTDDMKPQSFFHPRAAR